MKRRVLLCCVLVALAAPAQAGHLGFGFGGGFGHRGFFGGGHHGGRLFGDGLEDYFEVKFENLMTDYDDGLSDIEDFYTSDEYSSIVDDLGLLIDRHDLFLAKSELSADRLGVFISTASDELSFYEDLLDEYLARDDLSEERLERIEDWLTSIQDRLSLQIDIFTEKQTTLLENLESYQIFHDSMETYLNEIMAAAGGSSDEDVVETAVSSVDPDSLVTLAVAATASESSLESAVTATSATLGDEECQAAAGVASAAVPEPRSLVLLATAMAIATVFKRRRVAHHRT